MLFASEDLPLHHTYFKDVLTSDGGVLGHYRRVARGLVRYYRESVRPAFPGLPAEIPQDMLGELLGLNFVNPVLRKLPEPRLTETSEMVHWLLSWRQVGAPTFQLSHSLASALLLTDPSNVVFEDLPWPYDSFVLTLPHPKGPVLFTDVEGREMEGRYVVVHRYRAPIGQDLHRYGQEFIDRVNTMVGRLRTQGTDQPVPVNLAGLDPRLPVWGPYHYRTHVRIVSETGVSLYNRSFWPAQEPDSREAVRPWVAAEEGSEYSELTRTDRDAVKAVNRIVANLSLYLATLSQNKRPAAKKRRGVNPETREEGYDLYEVPLVDPEKGTVIKLDPALREAAASWCREGHDPKRWSLSSRVAVIGHWKQVPYGPMKPPEGVSDWKRPTRRKWIAPYKRGPDAAETVTKTYRAEGPPGKT